MDIISQLDLKRPLFKLRGSEDLFVSSTYRTARADLIAAALGCESPVVLTGVAGAGKTVLLDDVARQLAANGAQVSSFASPALAAAGDLAGPDIILVDEADTASRTQLAALVFAAGKQGTTVILAAHNADRIGGTRCLVRLAPMPGKEANDYLLDAAARAGRPDLFSAAAQDAIVDAAHGVPRIVKLIANAAAMEAIFDGANTVEARHVAVAVVAAAPLPPPASDYTIETETGVPIVFQPLVPEPILLGDSPVSERDDDETGMLLPPPPAFIERQGFLHRVDTRGIIIGSGALGLLVAAAAAYGINTMDLRLDTDRINAGIDRVAALLQPLTAMLGPPAGPDVKPPPRVIVAENPVVPVAETISAQPPPQLDDSIAPEVQEEVAVTGEIAGPPLPTPGTPGYRPPTLPLPTLSAAVRAGIVAADPKTLSAVPPPAPLSFSTAPLDTAQ